MRWLNLAVSMCALTLSCGQSFAAESGDAPSAELVERGKNLFTTSGALGGKFACILCHSGAKAIPRTKVAALGDRLPDVINRYILEKSKGKPIAKDSEEMKALAAYILHEHSV